MMRSWLLAYGLCIMGHGVKLKALETKDGEVVGSISLAEAAEIADRVGYEPPKRA